jgi:hypothetical protein
MYRAASPMSINIGMIIAEFLSRSSTLTVLVSSTKTSVVTSNVVGG